MALTLTLAREFLRDYNKDDSSTKAYRIYDQIANDSNYELHTLGEFDFDRRKTRLSYAAKYNTGTVSISAGGTAVTGSGTTFTSAMTGRYIRFNNEAQTYKFTYVSGTSATVETYLGSSNLSAVTYEITDERQAFPTRMRSVIRCVVDSPNTAAVYDLHPISLDEIEELRLSRVSTDVAPTYYAHEYADPASGANPAGYIWVHPAPSSKRIVTLTYLKWPPVLTAAGDDFGLPVEAEPVLKRYMLGALFIEQGDLNRGMAMRNEAKADAKRLLSSARITQESYQREEWDIGSWCDENGPHDFPQLDASVIAEID
jgi:hypothetical protein